MRPDRQSTTTDSGEPPGPLWNGIGPRRPFQRQRSVLDLFCEQADAAPDRPAVRYRDITLTYAELDRAADATAEQLIDRRIPRHCLIPLLVTDGPEFPAALFAALKAGAAFVPLDPGWPGARLRAIAADLDPPAVLATRGSVDAADRMGLADRTLIVDAAAKGTRRPDADRAPEPADLIYGYYTSGSTGAPKCALNRHRGLVNRLAAMSRRFGDGAGHVTLQNSRSTFDSAMWQVLWPLTSGGEVVLPHRDGILDLEQTALTIARHGVTITDFVPSVLAAFVSLLELRDDLREGVACLRRMLIGGEAANSAVVRRLRGLLPGIAVTNTFGPTECSIGSVFHDIEDSDTRIPIGRPIDNTAAVVLDDQRRPAPAGTVGEIYLGGECIGAGYLNDPERTRQAFVPNPFPEIDSDLLYRTGDLGSYDRQGLLHFMGRRDDQVKIGGVRVELGDVANTLAAHPLVGNAMAVVLGDGDDDRTLVGCVSPRSADRRPTEPELRRYAAGRLPAELAPHRIMVMDSLPVNRNGKADRAALLALLAKEPPELDTAAAHPPPGTPMEELVSAAWCDVLGREQVSVLAPFRDYGGTSLTAYRLTVELSNRLGRPVQPRDLLTAATVRAQAKLLANGGSDHRSERERAVRDIAWQPPQAIVITGATGFIGAHLLADLLRHSDAKLICLIRASDPREGARRLEESLRRHRLTSAWQLLPIALKNGRVKVVNGDLGAERLGLSAAGFDKLAATATGVVHSGAMVNLLGGYFEHRPANVLGMQELIKLAAGGNGCRLHALSTLSVFPYDGAATDPIPEHRLPASDHLPTDGYSLSKYVGERLLSNARNHGISSVVYRLGEVWPHRELGVANHMSVAHNLLYACALTGCRFDTDAAVDVTPVDVVSRFVARCASGEINARDETLHVLWPATLRFADAFAALAARRRLDRVSYAEFRRRLDVLTEPPDPDQRLARLSLTLPPPEAGDAAPAEFDRMFTAAGGRFDAERFQRLAGPPESVDPVSALDRYLSELASDAAAPAPVGPWDSGRDAAQVSGRSHH